VFTTLRIPSLFLGLEDIVYLSNRLVLRLSFAVVLSVPLDYWSLVKGSSR